MKEVFILVTFKDHSERRFGKETTLIKEDMIYAHSNGVDPKLLEFAIKHADMNIECEYNYTLGTTYMRIPMSSVMSIKVVVRNIHNSRRENKGK